MQKQLDLIKMYLDGLECKKFNGKDYFTTR